MSRAAVGKPARRARHALHEDRDAPAVPLRLLSVIAPPRCGICGAGCGSAEPVCDSCATELARARPLSLSIPGADQALAAATYTDTPRALVTALKFGRRVALATVAAEALARLAPAGAEAVVPVPADPWRLRLRGFDPAALIAADLARRLDIPLSCCLERRHGRRQVGKARAERLAARPVVRIVAEPPVRTLLIDDVVTTGATLAACARALRSAGAGEILALAFARA